MHSFDAIPDGAAVGSDPSVKPRENRSTAAGFGSPGVDSTVKRIDLRETVYDWSLNGVEKGSSRLPAGLDRGRRRRDRIEFAVNWRRRDGGNRD